MDEDVVSRIRSLEAELLRSETRQSASRLDALFADDFMEIGASGVFYRKGDAIKLLPTLPDLQYEIQRFQALALSTDLLLVTYELESRQQGEHVPRRSMRSSLWRRREGRWQILFHQGTPVPA
jgi:hypothetical protein